LFYYSAFGLLFYCYIVSLLRNTAHYCHHITPSKFDIPCSIFMIQIFSYSEHHPFKNTRFHRITPSKFGIPCSIFMIQIFSYSEHHSFKNAHFHSNTPSKFDIPCSIFMIQIDTKKSSSPQSNHRSQKGTGQIIVKIKVENDAQLIDASQKTSYFRLFP